MKDHEIDEHLHNLNEAEILTYKDMIAHCEAKIKQLTGMTTTHIIAGRYTEEELIILNKGCVLGGKNSLLFLVYREIACHR